MNMIHPPIKASPYKPKTIPPVASTENALEHAMEMVVINRASK